MELKISLNKFQKLYSILSKARSKNSGFTVLELSVVIVVLSILGSIAIPNINKFIKQSKIDSAKAKLNSTAAICLQDIRQGSNSSNPINTSILSDEILGSDGYKISTDMKSCSSLMIESKDDEDPSFFPMGFAIADGRLTKFAVPLTEDSERACKSWAGSNCKAGEELKKLIEHNKKVQEAKTACNENFYAWLNGTPAGDGKRFRWDPTADSDCKRIPPANTSNTCTTDGCSLETWAFEGTIVAGEEGYKQALEDKYGKACSAWLDQKKQSKYTGGPESILECGSSKAYWFYKGEDKGSEKEMNKLICKEEQERHLSERTTGETKISTCEQDTFFYCKGVDKGNQNSMQGCIDDDAEETCKQDVKKELEKNTTGKYTPNSSPNAPEYCRTPKWLCPPEIYTDPGSYEASCPSAIKPIDQCKPPPTQRCLGEKFRNSKNGSKKCKEWAECMGYQ